LPTRRLVEAWTIGGVGNSDWTAREQSICRVVKMWAEQLIISSQVMLGSCKRAHSHNRPIG